MSMGKGNDTRIRMLAIQQMLQTKRGVSVQEILSSLERNYDISADRKTIYRDLQAFELFYPMERKEGAGSGRPPIWKLTNI